MKSIVHERWTAQYLSFGLQLANYCFYINFGEEREREREKDKLTDEMKENWRKKGAQLVKDSSASFCGGLFCLCFFLFCAWLLFSWTSRKSFLLLVKWEVFLFPFTLNRERCFPSLRSSQCHEVKKSFCFLHSLVFSFVFRDSQDWLAKKTDHEDWPVCGQHIRGVWKQLSICSVLDIYSIFAKTV